MAFEMAMMWFSGAGVVGGIVMWMADEFLGHHTVYPYILLSIGVGSGAVVLVGNRPQ